MRSAAVIQIAGLLGLMAASAAAQTPAIAPASMRCADCGSTGQTARTIPFDPSAVHFVTNINPPPPPAPVRDVRFRLIARVLRTSPLIVEMLDDKVQVLEGGKVTEDDVLDSREASGCKIEILTHVGAIARPTLTTLAFNDVITATIRMLEGMELTVVDIRKVTAPLAAFHQPGTIDGCGNYTGQMVEYHSKTGDDLVIHNDGGIEYRIAGSTYVERDTLPDGERAALLRAFAEVDFDRLPEKLPMPNYGALPSVTLIARRYQRVSLYGQETALAPVMARLDTAAARASAHARYLLRTGPASPVTIAPWPLPGVDLAHFYELVEAAAQQQVRGAAAVPGDFSAFLQPPPASIPPARRAPGTPPDSLRTFFADRGLLYRVERPYSCSAGNTPCRVMDLYVEEIPPVGTSLDLPGPLEFPGQMTWGRPTQIMAQPESPTGGRRVRPAPIAWLWPPDAGVALRDVPAGGLRIDSATFARRPALYRQLLKIAQVFAADVLEGGTLYQKVWLCHVEPAGPDTTCER